MGTWFTVTVKPPLECILVDRYGNEHKVGTDDIGKKWDSLYKVDNEHKRYEYAADTTADQPATRTAADAQRGDLIWYKHGTTGQTEYDYIDTVGNGHITMIPNAVLIEDFGTKWGYAEEEAK